MQRPVDKPGAPRPVKYMSQKVTVIGAGLAGSEAAWQLAQAGIRVRLLEMKPLQRTAAQVSDYCAELVCSNSLRSQNPANAVGCLKEEMYRVGSLIIDLARLHRVPAGDALAVNREAFGRAVGEALDAHPLISRASAIVEALPGPNEGPTIVATGPLTADALACAIGEATAADKLYFYDAIAPIISADSIDMTQAFAASRWGKGEGDDYVNCPMNKVEYDAFLQALLTAECMPLHAFEEAKYFQGCLPVEVIAASGPDALRYGPLKPVGLDDPRTGRWPHAVVQLRCEDIGRQAYNLVGFQTKLKYPEQKRILRMIPGLQNVEILRFGAIHRNTYIDAPSLLDADMRLVSQPHIRFAGQMTGVEGYVESAASGLWAGRSLAYELLGKAVEPPPLTSAWGALMGHVRGACRQPGRAHEPQNVNWSMVPPLAERSKKQDRKALRLARARTDFSAWASAHAIALRHVPEAPKATGQTCATTAQAAPAAPVDAARP